MGHRVPVSHSVAFLLRCLVYLRRRQIHRQVFVVYQRRGFVDGRCLPVYLEAFLVPRRRLLVGCQPLTVYQRSPLTSSHRSLTPNF